MRDSERYIVELVKDGFFRIDEQGQIWKRQALTRTGRRKDIQERIADKKRADGYLYVIVGRRHFAMSHRIVWSYYNGEIPNGMEINHKDGKRSNNPPGNLESVTPGENGLHAYRVLGKKAMFGERNPKHKLKREQVADIHRRVRAGESQRSIAREFNVSHTAIRYIINGTNWRDEFPLAASQPGRGGGGLEGMKAEG